MINEKARILIVEDSRVNVQILNEILKDDYDLLFAENGKKGVEMASTELPDLILMDAEMPEMNGYEACARLKAEDATVNIPVIFITALNQAKDEERGLVVGAIDYITKPISPTIVKMRVKNHVQLKQYRDLLESLASRDGMTGLANRRHFDECFAKEWLRAKREKIPVSVILLDVDHFKLFNDHYGHGEGDDCLKQVAAAIAEAINRPADLVARYGGEEFVCLLPGTDLKGALFLGKKIQQAILKLKIPHADSPVLKHVTMSSGVSTVVPDEKFIAVNLLKKADEQLYLAKEQGRNQVCGIALE
ncbi:MAG: diguanylate cyclase [Gammaproteobacteria bacterium]|nr:diguanylate cyclase [Gammaproteobacteria bacterium]